MFRERKPNNLLFENNGGVGPTPTIPAERMLIIIIQTRNLGYHVVKMEKEIMLRKRSSIDTLMTPVNEHYCLHWQVRHRPVELNWIEHGQLESIPTLVVSPGICPCAIASP